MIKKLISCLAFMVSCIVAPGFADEPVQSPQVLLDDEKLCTNELGKDDEDTRPIRVTRKQVMRAVTKEYPYTLDPTLYDHLTLSQANAVGVIPCLADYFSRENDLKEAPRNLSLSNLRTQCIQHAGKSKQMLTPSNRYNSYTKKYVGKGAFLARLSLLRLFEAEKVGVENGFTIAKRNNWDLKSYSDQDAGAGNRPEDKYIPLYSGLHDDLVLINYLFGSAGGDKLIFETYCKASKWKEKKPDSKDAAVAQKPEAEKPKAQSLILTSINRGEYFPDADFSSVPLTKSATGYVSIWDKITSARAYKTDSKIAEQTGKSFSRSFVAVKNSNQFASSAPEGISIGTKLESNGSKDEDVVGSGNVQLTADAALGYQFKWDYKPKAHDGDYSHTYKLTPFISIDQGPIDAKAAIPDPDGDFVEQANETVKVTKRRIAYAAYSYGARIDFESSTKAAAPSQGGPAYLNRGGTTLNGFEAGAIIEGITDNYYQQRAVRYGINASLPETWLAGLFGSANDGIFPGYKDAFALDGRTRNPEYYNSRTNGRNWIEAVNNGFHFEWDAEIAFDYVDFSKDKRPRDYRFFHFEKDDDGNDIGFKEPIDYALIGTNLSFDLTKRNLFGDSGDTAWISLGLDYSFRDGFKSDTKRFEQVTTTLKIADPAKDKRYFSIEYQEGEDFRTLQGEDQIAFNVGFIF